MLVSLQGSLRPWVEVKAALQAHGLGMVNSDLALAIGIQGGLRPNGDAVFLPNHWVSVVELLEFQLVNRLSVKFLGQGKAHSHVHGLDCSVRICFGKCVRLLTI